ncbi:MAG: DUF4389 domain-containing protein [Patescibacteria group bacterium]
MEEQGTKTAKTFYPHLVIPPNKKPNRFYAFPFFGLLIKLIILIPVFIESIVLAIAFPFVLLIAWFVVQFTGKYWDPGYRFFIGVMRFSTKISVFIYGLSDKYPGFSLKTDGHFALDMPKPAHPNKWLAIPILGFIVRFILLVPYQIFSQVLSNGSSLAMIISWFTVLFKKSFPESLYEFEHDTLRVSLAQTAYLVGLSDKYPSFSISMNHQNVKIALIIAGALLTAYNWNDSLQEDKKTYRNNNYEYQYEYENPQKNRDSMSEINSY